MREIIKKCLYVAIYIFILNSLYSQSSPKSRVYIGNFQPYKSSADNALAEKISDEVIKNFKSKGIEAKKFGQYSSVPEALAKIKTEEGAIFLSGYYKKNKDENLEIFAQVYNPESGFVIDALNVTEEVSGLTGIKLPDEETKETDNLVISKFATKIVILMKINSARKERSENIN